MLAIFEMIFIGNRNVILAELAFKYPFFALHIMLHCIFEIKFFSTLIWTCVLHSEAFFIQVINEVFDFHLMLGFITTVSTTARDVEVFIYIF